MEKGILKALAIASLWTLLGAGASPALAQQPNADEIVQRSYTALRGKTEVGTLTMTVKTPDWQRTLELRYWAVNPDKTFIRVTAPAKEAGTATLRLGSNMWNYLPSVERTIKIPPSLMLESWLGSDFSNDDLVRESSLVKDYDHKMDGEATEAGDACYRIIATPKPDAPVVWSRLVLYVRKSDDLPRREEYYDGKGKMQKVLTFDNFRETSGRLYPMLWKMVSVNRPGHETLLQFSKLTLDRDSSNSIFAKENLSQPF
ncbi:MAG: outer membrane lipoprotein-sorting protein [Candidatus Acidiferrales bacterium]